MSETPSYEENFAYSAPSFRGAGPLRLLTFDPLRASTTLSLSLVDAEQDHRFFAISYAWDKPVCKPVFGVDGSVTCAEATHGIAPWTNKKALCNSYLRDHRNGADGYVDILINGQNFYVQATVYHLLQTLQASAEIQQRLQNGEYFWLDAICIDQNDESETKQQTSNMHEIYKAAQHVFAWLGKAYNRSCSAMDFLSHQSYTYWKDYPLQSRPLQLYWRSEENQYPPLYSLFIRPYWQRIWVIQEFLLARDFTLLCGDRAVTGYQARALVSILDSDHEFLKRHPEWAATPAVKIIQARTAFISSRKKPRVEAMIHHFLFARSTYPEDKLIGLLKVSFSTVQPDFSGKSGSVEKRVEVIERIVRASRDQGMSAQIALEWQRLLACLLGVRGMLLEPEGPQPEHELPSPMLESPGPTVFSLGTSLQPQARRRPATSSNTVVQRPVSVRVYPATSHAGKVVGSVRSAQPADLTTSDKESESDTDEEQMSRRSRRRERRRLNEEEARRRREEIVLRRKLLRALPFFRYYGSIIHRSHGEDIRPRATRLRPLPPS